MANIHEVAASQGMDFRAYRKLAERGRANVVANLLFTAPEDRTAYAEHILDEARGLAPRQKPEIEDKRLRRMRNVNAVGTGRVNGSTLSGGQPRGNPRRR
jgi:hypothetical protein